MSKSFRSLWVVGFLLAFVTAVSADKLDARGKEWLDAHKDPAGMNVSGNWDSDFGLIHLVQEAGSRDVAGGEVGMR